MTVQDGIQLIGTLGFPIVMVLAFLWFLNNKAWPWLTAFCRATPSCSKRIPPPCR